MLRLKNPVAASFTYIFPEDDAIDKTHPDFSEEKYLEDLDPKYLPEKTGHRATKFICRPLSRDALVRVCGITGPTRMENEMEAAQLALACGLRAVVDGPPELVFKVDKERIDAKGLDALFLHFGLSVLMRLGGVIVSRSSLSPF